MRKIIFIALFIFTAQVSAADYIVVNGVVTRVGNTIYNSSAFTIHVSGGTVNMCEGAWIIFPVSSGSTVEAHSRAYATALTAFSTGAKVNIYNYTDSSCNYASFIELVK